MDDEENAIRKKRDLQVKDVLRHHLDELGSMTYEEKSVSIVFFVLVMAWFFRAPGFMKGWGDLVVERYQDVIINGQGFTISDSTSAIILISLLFVLPKKVSSSNKTNTTKLVCYIKISKLVVFC